MPVSTEFESTWDAYKYKWNGTALKYNSIPQPAHLNTTFTTGLSSRVFKIDSLFDFKPSTHRHFFPHLLYLNIQNLSNFQSQVEVSVSELMLFNHWYELLMNGIIRTMIPSEHPLGPQGKDTIFIIIHHIFCDIPLRIIYMFTGLLWSTHQTTDARCPVTTNQGFT